MKTTVAAIEFGTSKIVTLIGEIGVDLQGQLIGYGVRPYSGFTRQGWNGTDEELRDAILSSINEAQAMARCEVSEIFVGVPAEYVSVLSQTAEAETKTPTQKVTLEEVDAVMEASTQKPQDGKVIIHQSPAWFEVSGEKTMEPLGKKGDKLSCCGCVIYAEEAFTKDISDRLQALGYTVKGFLAPSLGEALMMIPPEERDRIAVLIDCGYLSSQVMVVQGDALVYLGVIEDGSGFFTAELARELELTMALAEQVKRKIILVGGENEPIEVAGPDNSRLLFSGKQAFSAIEEPLGQLIEAIGREIENCGIEIPQKASYYLTGGGLAPMRASREFLSARLGRPIKASVARPSKLVGANYSSSVGLLELVFEQVSEDDSVSKRDLLDRLKSIFKK